MKAPENEPNNCIGRRGFLKSLFGLSSGGALDEPALAAPGQKKTSGAAAFFWCDLKTGFIGFPGGMNVPKALPGSLMKLVAAAALVEEHLINANQTFDCHGHFSLHHETFHCQLPHGRVDLVNAIAQSCNCYFVQASEKLSTSTFIEYAKKLGLSEQVGRAAGGLFPSQPAGYSTAYILGLEPQLQPNALQIMRLSALIAMRGELPYLHSAEDVGMQGQPFRCSLSDATWDRLRMGMELAARTGTARKLDAENKLQLACKTGTAPHGKKFQSWITGYFPCHEPKHAFSLFSPSGTSQEAAVPLAHSKLFETEWP